MVFPHLRSCLGSTPRAGVVGMAALVASLTLCLASIWCPGSPFDLGLVNNNNSIDSSIENTNITAGKCEDPDTRPDMTSICVLIAGIIGARFGLWLADLSVTQILQVENITSPHPRNLNPI